MTDHKVYAITNGAVDYSLYVAVPNLPLIDAEHSLEQCGDWTFIAELLQDIVNEREERVAELEAAIETNDPEKFHKSAHAIKGAALNLFLPALVDVSKRTEALGKQLEIEASKNDQRLLASRQPLIQALLTEYQRIEEFIPEAQQLADEEAAELQ